MTRTPYDSMPYFCTWCGGEWDTNECPSGCCELESEAEAEERAWLHAGELPYIPPPWPTSVDWQRFTTPADAMPVLRPIAVEVARLTADEFVRKTA